MKFVTSYSFGKDSALALYRMQQQGHQPIALLTTYNQEQGRSWIHGIQPVLMEAVANSLGLPLILCPCTSDNYHQALEQGLRQAKELGAEACVFGDIDIEEHAEYDRNRCATVGLSCELPLWQEQRPAILQQCLAAGFKPLIKTINSAALDTSFLGQTLTLDLAKKIAASGADICGENGEYHTFVYDGPLFSWPIPLVSRGIVNLGSCQALDIHLGAEAE